MIQQMISLDPSSRPTFDAALASARGHILPESFYAFLHEYVASFSERATPFPIPPSNSTTPQPSNTVKSKDTPTNVPSPGEALANDSDHRIQRVWDDYATVEPYLLPQQAEHTDVSVDYDTAIPSPLKPHQVLSFRWVMRLADITHQDIFPVSLQVPSYTPSSRPTPAEDGPALILLSLVLANIRNCSLPSSRIRALDVLLALCAHLTDESKLDRAVPYVVELLRDEVAAVRAAAVKTLMQIVGVVPFPLSQY